MDKIKIGILCPSEIAFRRFMPALLKNEQFEYVGLAVATEEEWSGTLRVDGKKRQPVASEYAKAENFQKAYGGKIYTGYSSLLSSEDIDAVYIPLPPALHYKWARLALKSGKHVLLEKPFTTSIKDTEDLISMAKEKELAVHENYMFVYHTQLEYIKHQLTADVIGDIRLLRIDFGFPFRGANDFRYNKELGGGALLDCGGYTLKLATYFLGETTRLITSQKNYNKGFDVDTYGSATLVNEAGLTAQVSFGMDNSYKCSLEVWGSKGTLFTNRILTAPEGFEPVVIVRTNEGEQSITLPADDTFYKSIEHFKECILEETEREETYKEICKQAELVERF